MVWNKTLVVYLLKRPINRRSSDRDRDILTFVSTLRLETGKVATDVET